MATRVPLPPNCTWDRVETIDKRIGDRAAELQAWLKSDDKPGEWAYEFGESTTTFVISDPYVAFEFKMNFV